MSSTPTRPVVPTQGDRPTVGFGSTFHENGAPVKMGDTTTPVRALIKAQAHIAKEESIFRDSLAGVPLYQGEYDLYMDWVYQYGTGALAQVGHAHAAAPGQLPRSLQRPTGLPKDDQRPPRRARAGCPASAHQVAGSSIAPRRATRFVEVSGPARSSATRPAWRCSDGGTRCPRPAVAVHHPRLPGRRLLVGAQRERQRLAGQAIEDRQEGPR